MSTKFAANDWSSPTPPRGVRTEAWWPAMRLAGIYIAVAAIWIVTTDFAIEQLTDNPVLTHQLQTFKGLAFVVVTGGLLLLLVYGRLASSTRERVELAESRRMLDTLLSNLPGMAYRCRNDRKWSCLVVSQGVKDLTGYDAASFLNGEVCFDDLLFEDDREPIHDLVNKAVAERTPYRVEFRLRHADGGIRWVWEQGQAVYNDAGEVESLEGFITDITERKRAEQLESEQRHLVEARRAMEREIGVIGHEMRTPLASLRAVAELLMTESNVNMAQQEQLLRAIHDETVRMTDMANNMLEAARLHENGQLGFGGEWSAVSLHDLCQSAIAVAAPLTDPERVRLEVQIQPVDLTMFGDFSSLRRLLINLLSNAVQYTDHGHIRIRARLDEDDPHGKQVHLTVEDTGRGIDPERAQKLGVAFALHHGRDDRYGAGLGLAICRDIVEHHGGNISFQTSPGEGTVFHIHLPVHRKKPRYVPGRAPGHAPLPPLNATAL